MKTAFSPAAIVIIVLCAVFLLALSVLLPALDDRPIATSSTVDPSSFSTSAIGHAGFYETLRRLGQPVEQAVGDTLASVGADGTLIVAEPMPRFMDNEDIQRLQNAPRLLLVLPKWRGERDEKRAEWVGRVRMCPAAEAQNTLAMAATQSWVTRRDWPENSTNFTENPFSFTPTGSGRIQLIRSEVMRPIIATSEGILLGEVFNGNNRAWVLADPDILSNHGLGRGQNAALMAEVIDALRQTDGGVGPVVFDETVHGFVAPEWSPIKIFFRKPFAAVTAAALLSLLIMLWAGAGRFGAVRAVKAPLSFGKEGLIANGARLLEYAGHQGVTLKNYSRMLIYSAATGLHAPAALSDEALLAWLDRVGRARKTQESCVDIMREITETYEGAAGNAKLYKCARRLYTWKGEILEWVWNRSDQ